MEPPGPRWLEAPQLATEGALVVLRVEGLRPMVKTLGGQSYDEKSLDSIETQVAQALALLNPERPEDGDRKRAAAVAVEFASLKCDVVAADVQAVVRGMRAITRRNANTVVERANEVRLGMAQDWRWPLDHQAKVEKNIEEARTARDMIFESAPWAPVMKAGIAAANVTQMYVVAGQLLVHGSEVLARVSAWLRGPGSGGAQFALAGEGGTLAVQLVAESEVLVLTEAELAALARAGQVSGLALELIYLARGHLHHIATDKNWISDSSGGPWSPIFSEVFENARLSFDDPANLVEVEGHVGPHPEAYHAEVSRRLTVATRGLDPRSTAYREAVIEALKRLGKDVATPGTRLNKLVTGVLRE